MKKIKTSHNLTIPGYGVIAAGTPFNVVRYNKRFVYCELSSGVTLRLARKSDCIVVY